jgi:ubiquinone/menaquinone biosynthesis C-methylase UbiE
MPNEKAVSEHYSHGNLLNAIEASLARLGKTVQNVTIEDLAPVDEFHIGGRLATESFLGQLNLDQKDHVLDVGCGLGGAARYVANKYNNRVSGIDLTEEYIKTGNALCAWVNLDKRVSLHQGSALTMPFQKETFDGAFMMHVAMNIADKAQLFKEVFRVLRPGACFGIYDIMRIEDGDLSYPVPWATEKTTSNLATPGEYRQDLINAGFEVSAENNRREFALEFFKQLSNKTQANINPPPLGLHTLMQESTAVKIQNMIQNITANYIAPTELIAKKI